MHVYTNSPVETEGVEVYTAPLPGGGHIAVINLGRRVRIHLHTAADCDALIAAAAEAKRLLSPPVITDSERDCDQANPPHHALADGERACTAADNMDRGYICTAQDGHDGPDHIAYNPGDSGGEYHRWPMAAHADNAPEAGQ